MIIFTIKFVVVIVFLMTVVLTDSIDSTLHKLRETIKTFKSKENAEGYKSQITLAKRRATAMVAAPRNKFNAHFLGLWQCIDLFRRFFIALPCRLLLP